MAFSRRITESPFSGYLGSWGSVAAVVTALIAIWFADQRGGFAPLNELSFDACFRAKQFWHETPARVLLVELPSEAKPSANEIKDLISNLTSHGAARVGLAVESPELANLDLPNVILGKHLVRNRIHPDEWSFAVPTKKTNEQVTDPGELRQLQGVITLPTAHRGISRDFLSWCMVDGQPHPTFELLLSAANQKGFADTSNSHPLRVNFRGGLGSLPHVTATQVLNGQLTDSLVRDRVVLIGQGSSGRDPEVHTPTTDGRIGMSLLEYRGHVVNTLLTHSAIRTANPAMELLILLGIGLACLLIYQRLPVRTGFAVLLLGQILTIASTITSLGWFHLWLPVFAVCLLQMVCFVVVLDRRSTYVRLALNQLMFEMSSRIWQRRWPDNVLTQSDPWGQVITFLRQALDLDRIVIMELRRGQRHLKVVGLSEASESDVVEPRRDIHRRPFSDALAAQSPLLIDTVKRPFLSPKPGGEIQYLVPLRFAGRVFGFIATSVESTRLPDRSDFEAHLRDFADQTAELLHRRNLLKEQSANPHRVLSSLSALPEETAYSALHDAASMIDRRLDRMEQIFHEASTPTIIFDLFGRQLMVNQRMKSLLSSEKIAVDSLTTIDLLTQVTGGDLESSRLLLKDVISEKRTEMIPVHFYPLGRSWMIQVRPLLIDDDSAIDSDEATPFHIRGIVCELVEQTLSNCPDTASSHHAETIDRVKKQLSVIDQAFNELQALDHREQHRNTSSVATECEHPSASRASDLMTGYAPENPVAQLQHGGKSPSEVMPLLNQAISYIESGRVAKKLDIVQSPNKSLPNVRFDSRQLVDVFCSVLRAIIDDAEQGSAIGIVFQIHDEDVVVAIANQRGSGVITDSMRDALEGRPDLDHSDPLARAARSVATWGGSLVGSGKRGEGLLMRIHLKRADVAESDPLAITKEQST